MVSLVNRDRSRHSRDEVQIFRNALEPDPHGDTLGEADPLESGADIGQQILAGTAVVLGDPPADAVDSTLDGLVRVGHQGDDSLVAGPDGADYVLPEERIAQSPVEPRHAARLLMVPPADAPLEQVRHQQVWDWQQELRAGDLLVQAKASISCLL